jgi:hypothetical protein
VLCDVGLLHAFDEGVLVNKRQLEILQHSLGVDQYGCGIHFRNHFVTGPLTGDGLVCQELCDLGFMFNHGPLGELTGQMNLFRVTPAGTEAMLAESPRPPKIGRSQQRYLDWLRLDSCTGETFGQYLKRIRKAVQHAGKSN